MSDSFGVLRTAQPFAVGGFSGMLASSVVHPIDLSKVRLQLFATMNPDLPKPSFATIIGTMIRNEGFTSIYAGLSAALLRQAVYGTARIGLHRSFSSELQRRNDGKALSFPVKILSGMASGSIAVCLGTPFDVALVRMQADSMKEKANRRGYKNVFDALARVFREEGLSKLYSGLYPNILRGMSVNAGMLACFDQAKEFIGENVMHDPSIDQPSLPTQLLASMISGFTASFFSLPFDLLKSRLQDGNRYSGIVDAATKILKTEGVLSFWTGFGAYYMRTAPHAMIILMLSEPVTKFYSQTVLR
eukprot:gene25553-34111_t